MSKTDREYDWLNDPFDDSKQEGDLKRAQASQRTGCVIGALVIVVVVIAVCAMGCMALSALTF